MRADMSGPEPLSRRKLLGAGCATLIALHANAAQTQSPRPRLVTGRVLEQASEVSGTSAVADVLVSNGVEVTRTNRNGEYTLPEREDLFIIKPAHWSVSVDPGTQTPQFYRPYSDKSHTPPVNSNHDFILTRRPEPTAFNALMFADPQPANLAEVGYLRAALTKIHPTESLAFGLTLGDIASDNLDIYEPYQQEIGQLGIPFWSLPGNHDHDVAAPTTQQRLKTWRRYFGPPTYAFEYGKALFIMLDNVSIHENGAYFGAVSADGLSFIQQVLAATPHDRLVVVCTHIPLVSSYGNDESCNTMNTKNLLGLLSDRPAVSFSGHMHKTEHHYLKTPDGKPHHHHVITALSGSWWSGPYQPDGQPAAISSDGTPNGWHILSIDDTSYSTRFIPAKSDAIARAIVDADNEEDDPRECNMIEIARVGMDTANLYVNVYDGGPRTRVYCDMNGERRELKKMLLADPSTQSLYVTAQDSLKHWVRAEESSHLWMLEASTQHDWRKATITIVDEYGRRTDTKLSIPS